MGVFYASVVFINDVFGNLEKYLNEEKDERKLTKHIYIF